MNKIIRNVCITISAIIGLIAVTIAVLKLLGIDIGIDCPVCSCNVGKKINKSTSIPQTKIKRNYTEIKLPEEA